MVRIRKLFDKTDVRAQYTELVQPHIGVMYRMAWRWTRNREESEDLVQDVLVRLVTRVNEMQAVEQLRPWLIKVLYRRFVDLYRRNARSPFENEASPQADTSLEDQLADDRDDVERFELQQALLLGLDTLDDDQRDAVLLHDVEGYTAIEIAEILDTNVGTVKSRVHRGRSKLKEFLEGEPFGRVQRVKS